MAKKKKGKGQKRTETAEAKKKRLANLRPPFKKGEKPPPGVGRPKGSLSRATLIRKFLLAQAPGGSDQFGIKDGEMLVVDQIVLKQVAKALNGDPQAYDRVMDGSFGKVADVLNLGADTDGELDVSTEEAAARTLEGILKNAGK